MLTLYELLNLLHIAEYMIPKICLCLVWKPEYEPDWKKIQ